LWGGSTGGDDLDVSLKFFAKVSGDDGADGRDEEEEADGIGQEAGGDEDGSGEEDHDAIEGFTSGKATLAGGFVEFFDGAVTLRSGQGRADDGGDDDNEDGEPKADFLSEGGEKVEFRKGDEDEEDEKFSEHDLGGQSSEGE